MGTKARIECRRCGTHATVATLRNHHGPTGPRCIGHKAWMRVLARDERHAGKDTRVLELAGVTRREALFYWYHERHEDPNNPFSFSFTQVECVRFTAVAPIWAIKLARRLMDDQALVEKLGIFHVEKRVPQPETWRRKGNAPDGKKKVIPIRVRARIIGTAAQTTISRMLFEDDLEAALIMLRDIL